MLSVTRSLYHSLLCINEMLYSTITAVFHDLVKLRMTYLFHMKSANRVTLFGGSEVLIRSLDPAVHGPL